MKKDDAGAAKRARTLNTERTSVVFAATYGTRTRDILVADMGSDGCIMGQDLLTRIQNDGGLVQVQELAKPVLFNLAVQSLKSGEEAKIVCDKVATMTVELHIRHGTTLVLRNLKWFVTKQPCNEPLLSRQVLETLGLNTEEILASAADRHSGEIDMSHCGTDTESIRGKVARIVEEGVYHADAGVDDMEEEASEWVYFGEDGRAEKAQAVQQCVGDAVDNGISPEGSKNLKNLLHEYDDVLRIRLGPGPPAKVEPMKIELIPVARPVRAKQRRYPTEKRIFLERVTAKLLEYEFVRHADNTEWVAQPLIVKKKPLANYRLTIDLRPVNAVTKPVTWPMPNIEAELGDLKESSFFCSIDFCSGYWQLPLDEDCQHLHAFMTTRCCVMPTRTLQGAKNSVAKFQGKVEPCFADMREALRAWLDDFALHAKTEAELLERLEQFLETCRKYNLKVSLPKSTFFTQELKWCGRIVDKKGVRLDPSKLDGLKNCSSPQTAAELCEYVHCLNWMSPGIPDFAERIAPLRVLLEEAHKRSGSRTKKSIQKYSVQSLGWGPQHEQAFESLQERELSSK